MLEEESLDSRQDAARTALNLLDSIPDDAVEEEALHPRVVEVAFSVFEQEVFDAVSLLKRDLTLLCVHGDLVANLRVDLVVVVQIGAEHLPPFVVVLHPVRSQVVLELTDLLPLDGRLGLFPCPFLGFLLLFILSSIQETQSIRVLGILSLRLLSEEEVLLSCHISVLSTIIAV